MNIKEISVEEAQEFLVNWAKDRKSTEKGLFWYTVIYGGKTTYIGIDNTTCDMFMEEFDSVDDCLRWLRREELDECV